MKRRTVLATLGTATVATAGCLDRSGNGSTPTDTDGPGDSRGTATPTGATDTPTDGTGWPDGRFADEPCPAFAETDRTVCYHTLDYGSLYVEPSQAVFAPGADERDGSGDGGGIETIEFVLHNETGDRFGLNPHAWAIHRQTADGWTRVAPEEYVEPWLTLEAGETYTWVLSEHDTAVMAENEQAITTELAAGVHAFAITGQRESESGGSVECIALFSVER
ncbi:hypothetical protein ACOZ4N_19065 [Halorientalis pallida]|uniref:hypothetical protein n=1 Tax=Halorientalis pallida TaxID=2479928 RepID=UPI003C70528C